MSVPHRPTGKPREKSDAWGWFRAIFFPKKSKPLPSSTIHEPARAQDGARPAPEPIVLPGGPKTTDAQAEPGRGWRILWTTGSLLSIGLNLVLLLLLSNLLRQAFVLKQALGGDVLGGLYYNFVKMDQAHIRSDITVSQAMPVNFDLQISQDTEVTLTRDTRISAARVSLTTGGLEIVNAPADILLPAGTRLPVHLDLSVPVQTGIPVNLNVPVDIPLAATDLHEPFVGLQDVVAPYYWMFKPEWRTWEDVPACKALWLFCVAFFK